MIMQTPDMQAILERLDRLEKQNRRLKRLGVTSLLIVAALALTGQARPKARTVEAERFVLRDGQGRARITIGTPKSSGVAMDLAPDEPVIY